MNCETTHNQFSDYFDGGLSPAERAALEVHLKDCQTCTVEYGHFTESMKALHETRPLETTQIFLANVRAAAAAHLEKRENYLKTTSESVTIVTPKADAPPEPSSKTPGWVPWSLAAVTLVAFLLGFSLSRRGPSPELEQLQAQVRQLQSRPPERIVERIPADPKKVLQEKGLVEQNGQWVSESMVRDFAQGKVCIGGAMMDRKAAAQLLVKEFPPEVPPLPPPVAMPTADEILEKAGYAKVNELSVPKAWVEKWSEGLVQVGVNEWRKPADFKEELIREHNLVEVRGKLMTREQADAIQAQQLVRIPDAATASNDFTRSLEGLQIVPSVHFRGVTIYLLLSPAPAANPPFVPLHAALASGKVELVDGGGLGLFAVQVKNGTETDLLLLAGEVLTGGRCSRVVSEDTLVPKGQAAKVAVLCVEPGVWNTADKFAASSGHYLAPPQLRRSLVWEQGQGALWSLVAKKLAGKPGLADLFRKHVEAITEIRMRFSALPDKEPASVGMAVAIGDALEFVELFPDHATFTSYFERMLAGASLEQLERTEPLARVGPAIPNSMKGVKQFLESAFFCGYEAREDGYGVRRDDFSVGRVRMSGGLLQHAVLFAAGAPEWERRATYTLPKDKAKRAIDDYEARMKTMGPIRKTALIHELASINAPDVIALLLRHLAETDTPVKRAVIQELGASGDKRVTDPLLQVLERSRQEPAVFAETVRALARLGDERSVERLLRQADAGEAELTRVVILGMPELLLQVRTRDVLERATARLIVLYEAAEGVVKGEGILDPVAKNLRPAEAQVVVDASRTTLKLLVGLEFSSSANARKWWNDRDSRDRFLRERTGK